MNVVGFCDDEVVISRPNYTFYSLHIILVRNLLWLYSSVTSVPTFKALFLYSHNLYTKEELKLKFEVVKSLYIEHWEIYESDKKM